METRFQMCGSIQMLIQMRLIKDITVAPRWQARNETSTRSSQNSCEKQGEQDWPGIVFEKKKTDLEQDCDRRMNRGSI